MKAAIDTETGKRIRNAAKPGDPWALDEPAEEIRNDGRELRRLSSKTVADEYDRRLSTMPRQEMRAVYRRCYKGGPMPTRIGCSAQNQIIPSRAGWVEPSPAWHRNAACSASRIIVPSPPAGPGRAIKKRCWAARRTRKSRGEWGATER